VRPRPRHGRWRSAAAARTTPSSRRRHRGRARGAAKKNILKTAARNDAHARRERSRATRPRQRPSDAGIAADHNRGLNPATAGTPGFRVATPDLRETRAGRRRTELAASASHDACRTPARKTKPAACAAGPVRRVEAARRDQ
jgi:hypothetical protein